MGWTTPRTWVAGETVTAALMNAHVRDNVALLGTPPSCRVTASSTANVSTGAITLVAFDGESWDWPTSAMHDTSTNNSRLVAPIAGKYVISATTEWTANATGLRAIQIRKNAGGSSVGGTCMAELDVPAAASQLWTVHFSDVYELAANDYLEVFRYQSSGGNLAPTAGNNPTPAWASLRWVGF